MKDPLKNPQSFTYIPIGIVRSPFTDIAGMPMQPNAIGLSIVQLVTISGNTLEIEDVDLLDGTPLLDIKPYVPAFDSYCEAKAGWFDAVSRNATLVRSDERFI